MREKSGNPPKSVMVQSAAAASRPAVRSAASAMAIDSLFKSFMFLFSSFQFPLPRSRPATSDKRARRARLRCRGPFFTLKQHGRVAARAAQNQGALRGMRRKKQRTSAQEPQVPSRPERRANTTVLSASSSAADSLFRERGGGPRQYHKRGECRQAIFCHPATRKHRAVLEIPP